MDRDQAIISFSYIGLAAAVGIVAGIFTGWFGALICTVLYMIVGAIWVRYRQTNAKY